MINEKSSEKNKIQDFERKLSHDISKLNSIKKVEIDSIQKHSENCTNIEKIINNLTKERKIAHGYCEKFHDFPSDKQEIVMKEIEQYQLSTPISLYHRDITQHNNNLAMMAATPSTMADSSGNLVKMNYTLMQSDPQFCQTFGINKTEIEDTNFDHIEFIKNELLIFDNAISRDFEKVIKKWRSTSEQAPDRDLLTGLRNVIFVNLFEKYCKEEFFSKKEWFKTANKEGKYPSIQKFFQTKYLILGDLEEKNLVNSLRALIDNHSNSFRICYIDLSKIGKNGGTPNQINAIYQKTIDTFYEVLSIRNKIQKSKPYFQFDMT